MCLTSQRPTIHVYETESADVGDYGPRDVVEEKQLLGVGGGALEHG